MSKENRTERERTREGERKGERGGETICARQRQHNDFGVAHDDDPEGNCVLRDRFREHLLHSRNGFIKDYH